jgi:hypothetical protein
MAGSNRCKISVLKGRGDSLGTRYYRMISSDCGQMRGFRNTSQELQNSRGEICCQRASGGQRPILKRAKPSCRTSANKQVRCVKLRCAWHSNKRLNISVGSGQFSCIRNEIQTRNVQNHAIPLATESKSSEIIVEFHFVGRLRVHVLHVEMSKS